MADAWVPFYFGDYLRATELLSLEQHGAYMLLLGHAYAHDAFVPANASAVNRICRCDTDSERRSAQHVLTTYFERQGEVYFHSRVAEVLKKIREKSQKARESAEERHRRKNANADANAGQSHGSDDADGMRTHPERKAKTTRRPCVSDATQTQTHDLKTGGSNPAKPAAVRTTRARNGRAGPGKGQDGEPGGTKTLGVETKKALQQVEDNLDASHAKQQDIAKHDAAIGAAVDAMGGWDLMRAAFKADVHEARAEFRREFGQACGRRGKAAA